ncbi:MAG: ATP-binding protein [Deltaproteobacteria bacterium]|nr:ATP-binding protein [Deltaproteobacteria bacterium]
MPDQDKTKDQIIEDLRNSVSLLHSILESTADGILVVNRDGKIVAYNQNFLDLWRIPQDIIESRDDDRALEYVLDQLKDPEGFLQKVRELYGEPDVESFDNLEFKDGRFFERYSKPQRIGEAAVGRVWSFRDVTERKRVEKALEDRTEALERSNKDLEQFAYVAAHDLREPLVAVGAYLKIIERLTKNTLEETGQRCIEKGINIVLRMDTMLRGLLSYSRVTLSSVELESTDSNSCLAQALSNLGLVIKKSGASVTNDSLPIVNSNAIQLVQVFQNLISNAIKYRGTDPLKVHVGLKSDDSEYQFSVNDNGIGIEPPCLERIFNMFERTGDLSGPSGTGIGLSTCRRIIERHRGRIWVESQPGRGSTFYFTLPKTRHVPAA